MFIGTGFCLNHFHINQIWMQFRRNEWNTQHCGVVLVISKQETYDPGINFVTLFLFRVAVSQPHAKNSRSSLAPKDNIFNIFNVNY